MLSNIRHIGRKIEYNMINSWKRQVYMEIVVHYPEDRQGISALRKAVAETHSEYIYSYIERLQCSQEQKKMIIKSIDEMLT